MIRSPAHLAPAAVVVLTAPALIAVTPVPASAATWKPAWRWSSATRSASITLDPVRIQVATRLGVSGKNPRVKKVQATADGPGGKKLTTILKLAKGKGNSTKLGTWRGTLTVPPQSPDGSWKVSFTATSTKGQTARHANAASFKITKTPPPALTVPSPVLLRGKAVAIPVQAFWARHVDGAYATLTAPSGGITINGNMARVGGNPDWGLWRTSPALPASSRPGTWTISASYVSGGAWAAGPSTTITVKQRSALSLKATPTKVKKGKRVKLTGRLTAWRPDGTNGGLSKRKVTVYYLIRASGAQWTKFATISTDAAGNYTYSPYVVRSGSFQIRYAGAGLFTGATSRHVPITVR